MLNATNGDQNHVVNYVEEYLDLVESLPLDMQRSVSLMKEIDARYQDVLKELEDAYDRYCKESDSPQRRKLQLSIQRALIRSQELGDEKIQIAGQMVELVENRTRQLDWHSELLVAAKETQESHTPAPTSSVTATASSMSSSSSSSGAAPTKTAHHDKKREEVTANLTGSDKGKRARRQKNGDGYGGPDASEDIGAGATREKRAKTSSKKKKRSKGKSEVSPPDLPIDPDEPTYCLCEQVSYGEMIGCDNDECPKEWFHFSCVGLHHKPKGKWYCPKCRGENEKTMDKALERAKKERAYNR
ncbi:inhibitor of growth protein 1 [Corythoichthys intestinalis]|uniref:inhibitor of growth protein 1 n=1 Tax=Corythoichthys intestinalis TaxID=161448 RepID=UPI0025A6474D|nr:inhibitor of growth protein 1 [Corythoichthys intestinalis]XP_061799907.1 inhibitor of growth protein 1-like [Nerophis lumbriciformis]